MTRAAVLALLVGVASLVAGMAVWLGAAGGFLTLGVLSLAAGVLLLLGEAREPGEAREVAER